ncbi:MULTISPECIES: hypothetical protein [Pseudomonas syringae group]|uniref:Uncharacterized protein n=2 Tax=Pseudomonas syringae group genomosp. 2 TaxID=251698 RepID=A0AAX1VMN9_PSEAJ|nr:MULTISPECIES: hypothetical protein [Pseudomonas syringae group]KEZ25370.1 hypothetical protein A3SK_0121415 [Pseudomonas amygdali pv. tabaci str. 6605]KIY17942.1 hypothetical protein RD00_12710 [Pseudomonas amygdali pv. tabaci]MDU8604797.1 hypothetical protein [Pseudomonas syringae group sp. 247E2]MDU8629864.1 hypothetical protein [Pseudomonas syringae group sp. 243L2]MDU8646018.1 hypothetical protein [Pseudomonas syringae group sp. 26L6]
MLREVKKAVFSWNGTATAVAVLGFLSSIVTNFIDTTLDVSIRWLIFITTLTLYAIIILLKVTYDAIERGRPSPPFENPIKYSSEHGVFVIRRNEHFLTNILVACYSQHDGLERLAYIGVVEHVQTTLIQIRIQLDLQILTTIPVGPDELKMLEIRPVIPFAALQKLTS